MEENAFPQPEIHSSPFPEYAIIKNCDPAWVEFALSKHAPKAQELPIIYGINFNGYRPRRFLTLANGNEDIASQAWDHYFQIYGHCKRTEAFLADNSPPEKETAPMPSPHPGLPIPNNVMNGSAPHQSDSGSSSGGKRQKTGTANSPDPNGSEPSGDMSEDSVPPVPRSFTTSGSNYLTFRKVHRLLSFGFAPQILELNTTANPAANFIKTYFMTSSLMNVPWDRPYFYMTPSEFSLLPAGARAVHMFIRIGFRNVRQAFKTNASTTDLASLHQSVEVIFAKGLNHVNNNGLNLKYEAVDNNKLMNVTLLANPDDMQLGTAFREAAYGVNNANDNFATTIPWTQMAIPFYHNHYYVQHTDNREPMNSGWENLAQHLTVEPANEVAGKAIVEMSYEPLVGFLKAPPQSITCPFPGLTDQNHVATSAEIKFPTANRDFKHGLQKLTVEYRTNIMGGVSEAKLENKDSVSAASKNFTYRDTIEKCQFVYPNNCTGRKLQSQPWVHVGILPCRNETVTDMMSNINTFSDMQAHFDIECEMTVEIGFPTHRPYAMIPNVQVEQQYLALKDVNTLTQQKTPINGLYRHAL